MITNQCSRYFGSSSFERAVLATLGFLNNLTFLSILPLQVLSSYSVHLVCPGIFFSLSQGLAEAHPSSLDSRLKVDMGGISTTLVLNRTDFRGSDPSLKTSIMSDVPCLQKSFGWVCLKLSNLMQLIYILSIGWS